MPETLSSVFIRAREKLDWKFSSITHDDGCGKTYYVAETSDETIGVTGDLSDILNFADTLHDAVTKQIRKVNVNGI